MGFRFINNLAVSICIAGIWLPENQGPLTFSLLMCLNWLKNKNPVEISVMISKH